jgi:D-amino-acid dehydrogenase
MDVIVLGGGVIGTTTAYELARRGARVTVIDRQEGLALETSFGNAGQVSPGYATPWAAPGIPTKALKWLFQAHAPLRIRPDGSLFQWQWLAAMLGQCTPERYARNKARMMRLAEYSRDCLRAVRAEAGLAYEQRSGGTLQLFRTQAQLDAAARDVAVLTELGVPHQLLNKAQLPLYEPALAQSPTPLAGGLRLPNDETGDCYLFTRQLAQEAERLGVRFRFKAQIERLEVVNGQVTGVVVDGERIDARQVVLALGSYSRPMLKVLGLDLPVYPVKGYSLTVPLKNAEAAPVSTVLDESFKVALTRFDRRLRVGGMAELAGFDMALRPERRATLEKVVNDLFPHAGELTEATFWTGLRPMTPDGTPVVGPTPYKGLWLNTGHGTLGWTMACGSGRVLADQVCGLTPEIDIEGLALSRYGRRSRTGKGQAQDASPPPPLKRLARHRA